MKTKLILLSMLLGSAVGQSQPTQTPVHVKDVYKAFKIYCATLRSAIESESKQPDLDAIALRDEAYSPQGDACTGQPGFEPQPPKPSSSTHSDVLETKTHSVIIGFGERMVYRIAPIDAYRNIAESWRVHDRLSVDDNFGCAPHYPVLIVDMTRPSWEQRGAVCAVELLGRDKP